MSYGQADNWTNNNRYVFQTSISDTSAENDFEIINAAVLLMNNTGCFRIVIVDDSDPEPA